MKKLRNQIRDYAWGCTTSIPTALGIDETGHPQAEMWMGAHPLAPSQLIDDTDVSASHVALDELIVQNPEATLGPDLADTRYLPFLMKLLAAQRPLSLQVHPTREQAQTGFQLEHSAGVPLDAAHRRYKDPHHKPEMIIALEPFHALCGFRPVEQINRIIDGLTVDGVDSLKTILTQSRSDAHGIRHAVEHILTTNPIHTDALASACVERSGVAGNTPKSSSPIEQADWCVQFLHNHYPQDPGVVVGLLLNYVNLAPGEALHLPAGNVHAYLQGFGIEVMASSDNVLRGGLTSKHVDVAELLKVVDFRPLPIPHVEPTVEGCATWWRPNVKEFALTRIDLADSSHHVSYTLDVLGPKIALCLSGSGRVHAAGRNGQEFYGDNEIQMDRGTSLFMAHSDGPVTFTGNMSVWCVSVPT